MSQAAPGKRRSLLARVLIGCGAAGLLTVALALSRGYYAFHDRLPGFALDLRIERKSGPVASTLRVGFAREKINPDLSNPHHPIYVAGFGQNRRATAIHD